jgi:ArsR family transcriptional regulator
MKILCDSGLVKGRKQGKWTHYSISKEGRKKAMALLRKLTTAKTKEVKKQDKECCE